MFWGHTQQSPGFVLRDHSGGGVTEPNIIPKIEPRLTALHSVPPTPPRKFFSLFFFGFRVTPGSVQDLLLSGAHWSLLAKLGDHMRC